MLRISEMEHGLNLHKSIRCNSFPQFSILLRISNRGVNKQNKNGDTPLLRCLILGRPRQFVQRLLSAGANITIANRRGISPLSLAIARCHSMTRLLLERSANTHFMYETALDRRLHEVMRTTEYGLRIYVIDRGMDTERILVCILTSNPLYNHNVAVRELNVFLDEMEADQDIGKPAFNRVCAKLIRNSILLDASAVFKSVWNRAHITAVACMQPALLHEFLINCRFNNLEFIECLQLILISRCVWYFIYNLHTAHHLIYYQVLFSRFSVRNVNKHDRMLIILRSVELLNVTLEDVREAYRYFGFNEEVVVLLRYFHPRKSVWNYYFPILNFIRALENNSKLSPNNIGNLDLVTKLSYRRLINSVPKSVLDSSETMKLKKKILNEVPSLFEMSRYVFQKSVQKFYNIQGSKQFVKVVENLSLPSMLKNNLCQEPPIYFDERIVVGFFVPF